MPDESSFSNKCVFKAVEQERKSQEREENKRREITLRLTHLLMREEQQGARRAP